MNTLDERRVRHRLQRLLTRRKPLSDKYTDSESKYTFYGGYDLGYLEGQISVLEDLLEDLIDERAATTNSEMLGTAQRNKIG